MMHEKMPDLMQKNEHLREFMPQMMSDVMPHCVASFSPMMEETQRKAFIGKLEESIHAAQSDRSGE
jgi:hypothetical protein